MVDFMIYTLEEIWPGPGLNLLLGPNGSGKSTVVSAIGIALAGETKSVGRFENLSDYVRSGATECMVEVELYGGANGRNLTIKRTFDNSHGSRSKFYLNDRMVKKEEVIKKMGEMNIQVNNLCVYLAQFRVGEFAEMKPEAMLEETELAADPRVHHLHQQLKADQAKARTSSSTLHEAQKNFDRLSNIMKGMEEEMKQQEEREETEQRMEWLKRRIPWCRYDKAKEEEDKANRICDDRRAALEEEKAKSQPLRDAVEDLRAKSDRAHKEEQKISVEMAHRRRTRQQLCQQRDGVTERLSALGVELDGIDEEARKRQRDLDAARREKERFQAELEKHRSESDIMEDEARINQLRLKLREKDIQYRRDVQNLTFKENSAKTKLQNATYRLRKAQELPVRSAVEDFISTIPSQHHRTQVNNDVILVASERARGRLKGRVIGPLMAQIQVKDPSVAPFIEGIITRKWATAWIVENHDDWVSLVKQLNGSVIHSAPLPRQQLNRPFNLEALNSHYGCELRYLHDAIECDDLVFGALFDVLAFERHVYATGKLSADQLNALLSQRKNDGKLRNIFTSEAAYSTQFCDWTDEAATRRDEPATARFLGRDSTAERERAQAIASAEQLLQQANDELKAIEAERVNLETTMNQPQWQMEWAKVEKERKSLRDERDRRERVVEQLNAFVQRIRQLEKMPDYERQKADVRQKIAQQEKRLIDLTLKIKELDSEWCNDSIRLTCATMSAATTLDAYKHVKAQVDAMSETHARLIDRLKQAKKDLERVRVEVQKRLEVAQAECDRSQFDALDWMEPNMTEELCMAKHDELSGALSRMIVDPRLKDRFKQTSSELLVAQNELAVEQGNMQVLTDRIEKNQKEWKAKVETMIKTIHEKFSEYFSRIHCRGAVQLCPSGDGSNNYGLSILVSYRKDVPLQPLSAAAQSGGEKSVATMLYLLCLQEVTNTPFRMVDEINQGMDARNEKLVFNQIVQACEPKRPPAPRRNAQEEEEELDNQMEPAQYFVVTPKLLPNLTYSKRVAIFNVYNGPSVVDQSEWDLVRFIKIGELGVMDEWRKRKRQRQMEADARALQQGSQVNASQDME